MAFFTEKYLKELVHYTGGEKEMESRENNGIEMKDLSKMIELGGKKIADSAVALTKHGKKNLSVRPY